MADEILILSIEDRERWNAEHRDGGLPSQSWHYAWALSASGINPKLAVVRSKHARMLMPFFERDWRGHTDIATTLGLSGASISPISPAPLSLWREYATGQGWVAGYVQLAPSVELAEPPPGDELSTSNAVFLLDLRVREVLAAASKSVRRKVRKASDLGATLVDDRRVLAEELKRLYPAAMRRLGAQPQYDFSPETLERWALDPSSVALGASVRDSVEVASVACVSGRQAEYHISGSTEDGRQLYAWLIWNAVTRLRDHGVDVLNIGGGVRPGDGIYRFKERFNGVEKAIRAVRQIYDHGGYDALCRDAGVDRSERYFPAYRAVQA
jgi:hypothetical protein